jgi:hypothetical protein
MLTRLRVTIAAIAVLSTSVIAHADIVLTWNDLAVRTFIGQAQSPFAQARLMAIVQLAVLKRSTPSRATTSPISESLRRSGPRSMQQLPPRRTGC